MLDISRTGKVFYEQFLAMSQGKNLSPIGVAYPPSIRYLNKRNQNKLANQKTFDLMNSKYKGGNELDFIRETGTDDRVEEIDLQNPRNIIKRNDNFITKEQKKNKVAVVKKILDLEPRFDLINAVKTMKMNKFRDIIECDYFLFCTILYGEIDDEMRVYFEELTSPFNNIDMREFLINCVGKNAWTSKEKCRIAFSIMDHEDSNRIGFDDLVNLLNVALAI